MSHFAVLVLTPGKPSEDELAEVLAPFDENTQVDEHDTPCWCIGREARKEVEALADTEFGTFATLRETFWQRQKASPAYARKLVLDRGYRTLTSEDQAERRQLSQAEDQAWKVWIKPRQTFTQEQLAVHPQAQAAAPTCDDCAGTGTRRTTYNPDSKWDWWQLGGRWTGYLDDYNPYTDPKNQSTCTWCAGTGQRMDAIGQQARAEDPSYTCNGCHGTGKDVLWSTNWATQPSDQQEIITLLSNWSEKYTPFAVLTPDGKWHERASMGWWGITYDEQIAEEQWPAYVHQLLQEHATAWATVVDCHI